MLIASHSSSESTVSETTENAYCIFLHVVEGIRLQRVRKTSDCSEKECIGFIATLNDVIFEVKGHTTETVTIFKSNCIWESELCDIKRMKTDNRPLKLEFFLESDQTSMCSPIGTLLLPLRGIQTISKSHMTQFRLRWHKLGLLRTEWRQTRPEVFLLLSIVKKTLIENGFLDSFMSRYKKPSKTTHNSQTSLMLKSQNNIHVQLLEQVGLLQIGNDPDDDCEIFHFTLTFQQVRHLQKVLENERENGRQSSLLQFNYDLLGIETSVDVKLNETDCHGINERFMISFKTSLRSLRVWFERIFYIPLYLRLNNTVIGNFHFNLGAMMPGDSQFSEQKSWTMSGAFQLRCSSKIISAGELTPTIDYLFNIQLLNPKTNKIHFDLMTLNNIFAKRLKIGERPAGDVAKGGDDVTKEQHLRAAVAQRNFSAVEESDKTLDRRVTARRMVENRHDLFFKSSDDFVKETFGERRSVCVGTEELTSSSSVCIGTENGASNGVDAAVNTDMLDIDLDAIAAEQTEKIGFNIVKELEEWKAQQINNFLKELERKEGLYMANLKAEWSQQRAVEQARLDAKIAHYEELDAKLQRANAEFQANAIQDTKDRKIMEIVKREIEQKYAQKKMEERVSTLEIKRKKVEVENAKLERENGELMERVKLLEKQLGAMAQTHMTTMQLKDMLNNFHLTGERLSDLAKSKNYYKEKWMMNTREMHKLKLSHLKEQEKSLRKINSYKDNEICIHEILSEEQEALSSDRSELKSIQEMLFLSSETSSMCEVEDE